MTHDVIVIGGGLAGLIAAREVARSGRGVLLVEARDRLGGRTWYKRDALNGLSLEMGGTWIDPSHPLVQAEVRRYGLTASEPWPFTLPDAWLLGGRRRSERLPVSAEDVPGFESFLVAVRAAAARIDPDLPLRCREGRPVFAGADVAVRSPGNIEGALESGFRAAAEAVALLDGE